MPFENDLDLAFSLKADAFVEFASAGASAEQRRSAGKIFWLGQDSFSNVDDTPDRPRPKSIALRSTLRSWALRSTLRHCDLCRKTG